MTATTNQTFVINSPAPELTLIPTERERALTLALAAFALIPETDRSLIELLDVADWVLGEEEVVELPGWEVFGCIDEPRTLVFELPDIDSTLLGLFYSELNDAVGDAFGQDEEPEEDFGSVVLIDFADAAIYSVDQVVKPDDLVHETSDTFLVHANTGEGNAYYQLTPRAVATLGDFHPTKLYTEEEYGAAPVGTQVRAEGDGALWTKRSDGQWDDSEDPTTSLPYITPSLADALPRKVLRWGFGA